MPNMPGRILAVDYGKARIGLAISDVMRIVAQSLTVVGRKGKSDEEAATQIVEIAKDEEVTSIVVGLPVNMDGSVGLRAEECQRFGQLLAEASSLPVDFYDERLTTVAAKRALLEADVSRKKRRQVIDSVAATMLLQSFLEAHSRRSSSQ